MKWDYTGYLVGLKDISVLFYISLIDGVQSAKNTVRVKIILPDNEHGHPRFYLTRRCDLSDTKSGTKQVIWHIEEDNWNLVQIYNMAEDTNDLTLPGPTEDDLWCYQDALRRVADGCL